MPRSVRFLASVLLCGALLFLVGCPPGPGVVVVGGPYAPRGAKGGGNGKATPTPRPAKGVAANGAHLGTPVLERVQWPAAASGADLLAVAALSSSHSLAVGVPGAAWTDGASVRVAPFPDGIADAVWSDGSDFAVAVGYGGIAYLWNGKTWSAAPTGTDADLHAVWGTTRGGARVVYAGGAKGTVLSLSAAGTWTKMSAPENAVVSVFAGAGDKVWAAGQLASGEPSDGVILRLDGDKWVDACHDLACGGAIYAAWASGPDDLWTGGAGGELVHYAGGQPELLRTGTRGAITAIWGTSPSDVFVAGDAGFFLWWNGKAWSPLAVGEDDLRGVSGLPSGEGWVVGANGTIRRITRRANGGS